MGMLGMRRQDSVFTNDIALVRLSRPVAVTPRVVPVRLPAFEADYTGWTAFVAGWGVSDKHGEPSPDLKAAELTVRKLKIQTPRSGTNPFKF